MMRDTSGFFRPGLLLAYGSVLMGVFMLGRFSVRAASDRYVYKPDRLTLDECERAFEEQIDQKIIQEAADKENTNLDDPESRRRLALECPQVSSAQATAQVRSRLLLRKLVLKRIPDDLKHHVYDVFKDDLTQYVVSVIVVANTGDAQKVQKALQGGHSFDEVAATMSQDPPSRQHGGSVGPLTMRDLESWLGPSAAQAVARGKAGSVTGPLRLADGPQVLVKMDAVRSRYDELLPEIEELLVDSRTNDMLYSLKKTVGISPVFLAEAAGSETWKTDSLPAVAVLGPASTASAVDKSRSVFAAPVSTPGHGKIGVFAVPASSGGKRKSVFAPPEATAAGQKGVFAPPASNATAGGNDSTPASGGAAPGPDDGLPPIAPDSGSTAAPVPPSDL